ncbi:MAG: hypothetical protein SFW07_06345, partial [Gammaproteobacteria bacterium]|nr:hypothetical protein [Gammaproteobacteria bacterium]
MNELPIKTQSSIELADVAAEGALAQEYEVAGRRRIRKGIFYWLRQVGNILWGVFSGLSFLKYFIPATMVVSAVSFGSTIKNMVDKKKTLGLIAGVILVGLLDLAISTGYDLVKWGVTIPGVAVASLSLAAVATLVLTILAVVSAVDFF